MQHPCFTPSEADGFEDNFPVIKIWYAVLLYILLIMLYTFPLMLYLSHLYNKNVLLILSKNF